jgi:recombination protein RecT
MPNEIVVFEQELKPLMPRFEQVLAGRMPAERLTRTVLVSCEKTPRLLQCSRQSLFNAAMTAAVLALEVDGVTGQGFIIPYDLKKDGLTAQFQLGYKGGNTLGARSGYSITAGTVREDDLEWDYREGSSGFVRHKRKLGSKAQIIAFWSVAESRTLPPLISILSIDDALAIKRKSPGARKPESPWNDPAIGFPAMGEKSARRRLNRSMPLNTLTVDFHRAAILEEGFEERGEPSFIREDGTVMIGSSASPIAPREASQTPEAEDLTARTSPALPEPISRLKADGMKAAQKGMPELERWWHDLLRVHQTALKSYLEETLKPIAQQETV